MKAFVKVQLFFIDEKVKYFFKVQKIIFFVKVFKGLEVSMNKGPCLIQSCRFITIGQFISVKPNAIEGLFNI